MSSWQDRWTPVGCTECGEPCSYFTMSEMYQCRDRCRRCAGLPDVTDPRCPSCNGGPLEPAPEYGEGITACATCDGVFRERTGA